MESKGIHSQNSEKHHNGGNGLPSLDFDMMGQQLN